MDKQNSEGVSMNKRMEDMYDDEFLVDQIINFGVTVEDKFLNHVRMDWERLCQMCIMQVICYIVHALYLLQLWSKIACKPVSDGNETNSAGNMDTPNHSHSTSWSKGFKRKVPMTNAIESHIEKMTTGIKDLTDALRVGNYYYDKFVAVAQKRLTILEQSKPRYYSEQEVWVELEALNVVPEVSMKCYQFLCENDKAKRQFFGVPPAFRLEILNELMAEAGIV